MRPALPASLVLALAVAGCGAPSSQPITQETLPTYSLADVGELYRLYSFDKKKPPAKLADLLPFESINPAGLHAVESGDVVVRFGASLIDTQEGPSTHDPADEILAYAKAVPESGGPVLLMNRTIRTMTADEFKSAKLAGTSSSTPAKKK